MMENPGSVVPSVPEVCPESPVPLSPDVPVFSVPVWPPASLPELPSVPVSVPVLPPVCVPDSVPGFRSRTALRAAFRSSAGTRTAFRSSAAFCAGTAFGSRCAALGSGICNRSASIPRISRRSALGIHRISVFIHNRLRFLRLFLNRRGGGGLHRRRSRLLGLPHIRWKN